MIENRVLVLNHFAVPLGYPGGTRHVELFSRLPDSWAYVILASKLNYTTGEAQEPEPGFLPVPVVSYRSNGFLRVLNWISYSFAAVFAAARQLRPDVVYASSPHLLTGLAGWLLARTRRAAFVLEVRDLWPRVLVDMNSLSEQSALYRILRALETFLYRRSDLVVSMAAGTEKELLKRGVPIEKVRYIPNGADPSDFEPSAPRETLRKALHFTRVTAVYAGAHGPANGLQALLEAAEKIKDLDLDVVLVGDGLEKRRLVAIAAERGLENVRFLKPVPKKQMADILHAADIGVHVLADVELFREAVSPNKVFDYMAASLPVLTNAPGLIGNLVERIDAGVAVGPQDIERGLRQLVSRPPEDLARQGRNGRAWLLEHQSRGAMSQRLLEALETVSHDGCYRSRMGPREGGAKCA